MPAVALALAVAVAAIALPHFLPLHRVAPRTASSIWLLALTLRSLVGIGLAVLVFVLVPGSALFDAVATWCLHTITPLLVAELGMSAHSLADYAVLLPAAALVLSVLWFVVGITRAGICLHMYLRRRTRGRGPLGTTVVEDPRVVVAVTAIGQPRLVVSEAALGAFDSAELAASLAHERGHLAGGHRALLLIGAVLRSLGRPLPGTAAAEKALIFNLERDADEYSVRQTRDPLALASAICKASWPRLGPTLLTGLGGRGGTALRLEYLLAGGRCRGGIALERSARVLVALMTVAALVLAVALPGWALASGGPDLESPRHAALICID